MNLGILSVYKLQCIIQCEEICRVIEESSARQGVTGCRDLTDRELNTQFDGKNLPAK